MAARYDFWKKPVRKGETDEHILVPKMISSSTVKKEELIRYVADTTTFSTGDLSGALEALMDAMVMNLSFGRTVELGDFGFFSLKLQSRHVKDKKEIHAQSISVVNANFRPSAVLKRKVRNISLKRSEGGFASSKESTPEKRRERLENYFENYTTLTVNDYCRITGLLQGKALRELNNWVKEGDLTKYGAGSHKVFMKKKD